MSGYTRFVTSNKNKAIFEFRSEVNNHLAPNVTLISSDNVKVKGHSIILASCHYFKELFKKDKTGNSHLLVFHENFTGDVLEFVVKYIYTGEFSLLDANKLPEVIRATSKEKFNIPALAKGYLLEQLDAPGGLNQSNWHIFYKSGIKLSLGEEFCNRIYAFLNEKYPEFYKGGEFNALTFEQIMSFPNGPFESKTNMEATLIWTKEHTEVGRNKLSELSKICTNLPQNGNTKISNPHQSVISPLSPPVLSADVSFSSPISQPATVLSDPHCSTTRKRARSISPQINTNQRIKRSNVVEVYHAPKYSWESAQLLFFGQAEASEPEYLWSYSFQGGEIKKMSKLPIENLEFSSLLVSQGRIYSIGGSVEDQAQVLVRSFPIRDLENLDKSWDEGPKLNEARSDASALLFRNTIYLIPENGSISEKLNIDGKARTWEYNDKHILYIRYFCGVALLDNVIYMIGGIGTKKEDWDSRLLDTGESYNIDDGTQSLMPNMNQARWDLQVITLKDRIYAIGGFNDDFNKLASVESYKPGDPNWTQVAHMNQHRAEGSSFVLDDMIYVAGGNYGKPTMERYCPQEDTWTMVDANLPEWADLFSSVLLGPNNF